MEPNIFDALKANGWQFESNADAESHAELPPTISSPVWGRRIEGQEPIEMTGEVYHDNFTQLHNYFTGDPPVRQLVPVDPDAVVYDPRFFDLHGCAECEHQVERWCLLKRPGVKYNAACLKICPLRENALVQ